MKRNLGSKAVPSNVVLSPMCGARALLPHELVLATAHINDRHQEIIGCESSEVSASSLTEMLDGVSGIDRQRGLARDGFSLLEQQYHGSPEAEWPYPMSDEGSGMEDPQDPFKAIAS
jgi:hypothetical protein